jgi:hypothetical protein
MGESSRPEAFQRDNPDAAREMTRSAIENHTHYRASPVTRRRLLANGWLFYPYLKGSS